MHGEAEVCQVPARSSWLRHECIAAGADAAFASVNFEKDIKPILKKSCYECHSEERKKEKAGFVFDTLYREGEFVAAGARYHVSAAQTLAQSGGGRLQQLVADGMAERVIDVLEVIEIEAQDRDAVVVASQPFEAGADLFM